MTMLPFSVTVSGGTVSVVIPFACSMMVMEDVPAGTSNVTTCPTVNVPRGVPAGLKPLSGTPALGTTGFWQTGFAVGHCGNVAGAPQAAVGDATRVGVAVQAATSLQAGGLSLPQEIDAARGRAQAAKQTVRIRTETPFTATPPTIRIPSPGGG